MQARRLWTEDEIMEIRERYPVEPLVDLAKRFDVPRRKLSAIAHHYGVKQNERPGRPWHINKVKSESSQLNPLALMESQHTIGQLMMAETDFEKAKKLEAIFKSMNEAIIRSL